MQKGLGAKLAKYRALTAKALKKIRLVSGLPEREAEVANDFLSMARNYFRDAGYFECNGELLTALAAYAYAHAWLDAGVRAKLLEASGNDRLFTLP